MDLLGRPLPNGGGDSFFNLALVSGEKGRTWIQVNGSTQGASSHGSAPGFHGGSSGLAGGADGDLGEGRRLGVAFGYDRNTLKDSLGGEASGDMFRASLYASQLMGAVGFSEVFSYAKAWNKTSRVTGARAASGDFTSDELTGAVQVSAPFKMGEVAVSPAAGLSVSRLTSGHFSETDAVSSAFALTGSGRDATQASPYVIVGLSRGFNGQGGMMIVPDALIGYRYDQAAAGQSFRVTAADGTPFEAKAVGLNGGSALLGFSLTAHKGTWTAFAKYRGQLSANWSDHSGSIGFRMAF